MIDSVGRLLSVCRGRLLKAERWNISGRIDVCIAHVGGVEFAMVSSRCYIVCGKLKFYCNTILQWLCLFTTAYGKKFSYVNYMSVQFYVFDSQSAQEKYKLFSTGININIYCCDAWNWIALSTIKTFLLPFKDHDLYPSNIIL